MRRGLKHLLGDTSRVVNAECPAGRPDEKGIETISWPKLQDIESSRPAGRPDEKGIETVDDEHEARHSSSDVRPDAPMRRGLKHPQHLAGADFSGGGPAGRPDEKGIETLRSWLRSRPVYRVRPDAPMRRGLKQILPSSSERNEPPRPAGRPDEKGIETDPWRLRRRCHQCVRPDAPMRRGLKRNTKLPSCTHLFQSGRTPR